MANSKLQPVTRPRLTVGQVDSWRAGVSISQIKNRLQDHIDGKIELVATQVQAAKILIDKCIPTLISQDITIHEDNSAKSPDDMVRELAKLLSDNPSLLAQIQEAQAKVIDGEHVVIHDTIYNEGEHGALLPAEQAVIDAAAGADQDDEGE